MLFGRCESQLCLMQLPQVSMYFRFRAEMFRRISSHICGIYVWVINRYYDCDIAHPRVPCKICSSFFSSNGIVRSAYCKLSQ